MSPMSWSLRVALGAAVGALTGLAFAQGAPATQPGQLRTDIAGLRAAARAQIREILTPEQQAKFDALPMLQGPPGGMGAGPGWCGGPGPHRGMGAGPGWCGGHGARRGMGPGPGWGGGGPRGVAGGANAPHWFLDRLTSKLNLTDAERASIQPILEKTHDAVQARREQARAAFRALLTPDQAAKLDQLKAQPGVGKFAHRGELQLTSDQKAQAHEIFRQMWTDVRQMRTDTRAQIRAQLTPEQQTQFDALQPARPWGGKHGLAGRRAGPMPGMVLDRLTSELSLTDAQRASVKTILDNLHAAVRERIQEARAKVS